MAISKEPLLGTAVKNGSDMAQLAKDGSGPSKNDPSVFSDITCPHCGFINHYQDGECENCGIDLALAAGMAVLAYQAIPFFSQAPLAPEILVPRLGEILIEKGIIQPADLHSALEYHRAKIQAGESCLFGQSLLDLNLINRETLDTVVTEQIAQLQNALKRSNRELEKRVEQRTNDLKQALQKLTELNQLKSNFIANISHELRTPLTHLKGYILLLAEGGLGLLSAEQQEALDVMVRAEARLEQLIDDLIQFSLMARGELSLNLRPVNVSDLLRAAGTKETRLAQARQVDVQLHLQDNLPMIRVDLDKIAWVLLQLLDNAIKFTPAGGVVRLQGFATNGLVTISVADTGIGIAAERIPEIFEPFHQLDGSNTRQYGGTGLGLSLVQRIIEAHDTVIQVQSEIGKGSLFQFTFPAINDV